jgi:hypothetical protein
MLWYGLLGLIMLWFFSLLVEVPDMEQEISAGVTSELRAAGYGRVLAEVRGRDVTLMGQVAGRHGAAAAVAIAGGVDGVRVVRDATIDAALGLPWLRAALDNAGRWRLGGVLPDPESRQATVEAFGEHGGVEEEKLVLDAETATADWLPAIGGLLAIARKLDQAEFEIGAGYLDLAGVLVDRGGYAGLMEQLETYAGTHNLRLVNRVATLRPAQ